MESEVAGRIDVTSTATVLVRTELHLKVLEPSPMVISSAW